MTAKELKNLISEFASDDQEIMLKFDEKLYPINDLITNAFLPGTIVIRAKEAGSGERAFTLDGFVIEEIEFQAIDTLGVDRADFEKVKEELYDKYLLCRDGEWDYIDTERFITDLSDFFREKQIDMVNFDEVEADMIEKAKAGEVTRLPRPKNLGDETGTFMMMSGQRNS